MPHANNSVSLSSLTGVHLPRATARQRTPFGDMKVANAGSPPASPPTQRGWAATPLPTLAAGSIDSLGSMSDLGDIRGLENLNAAPVMGEHAGGDGVARADYLPQMTRAHALDPAARSPAHQLQHSDDVERTLAALTQQWDASAAAAAANAAPGSSAPVKPTELFCDREKDASILSREHCARQVLSELGLSRRKIDELVNRHASTPGGTAVIDACRLLAMPEIQAERRVRATLVKQLDAYLDAAKGDYSGVYRAFKHDASKEFKQLKAGIETAFNAVGRSAVTDRLLADSAPALVEALQRKNPGVSSEALRQNLPGLINAQGFSALTNRLDKTDASGVLQDATLLPQLVQSADKPERPKTDTASEPVKEFVKHLVDVLGAMKAPAFYIENNARQIVNQDDWNFQGNKDPRTPEAAAAKSPPTADEPDVPQQDLPPPVAELEDLPPPAPELHEDAGGAAAEAGDIPREEAADDVLQSPAGRPRLGGRNGAPVHPLHGQLMNDLRANARFQYLEAGGVNPLPPQLQAPPPAATDEDDAEDRRSDGTAAAEGRSPFHRLKTPLGLGEHAPRPVADEDRRERT